MPDRAPDARAVIAAGLSAALADRQLAAGLWKAANAVLFSTDMDQRVEMATLGLDGPLELAALHIQPITESPDVQAALTRALAEGTS